MLPDPGEIVAAWPFAASLAAAASARGVQEARRRAALNEALHELRRPLQVLTLSAAGGPAGGGEQGSAAGTADAVRLAAVALQRLEREINGEAVAPVRRPLAAGPLVEAAVARWRSGAARAGSSLRLSWRAGDPVLLADDLRIAQALDNLLVNAIEHGGPRIEVEARVLAGRLRVAVRDCGRRAGARRQRPLAGPAARLSGRRRHGHGLRVVRRVAAEHHGRFELRRSEAGTEAVLELPLLGSGEGS